MDKLMARKSAAFSDAHQMEIAVPMFPVVGLHPMQLVLTAVPSHFPVHPMFGTSRN